MAFGNLSKLAERLRVKFVGGRLCLDFVNTVAGRTERGAVIRDKIASYEDLLGWSRLAGALPEPSARILAKQAALRAEEAGAVVERAIRLREALYRIFKCAQGERRIAAADVDLLRAELVAARSNQRFAAHGGRFMWSFPARSEALDRVLWPVSFSAAELLTSADLAAIGHCRGSDCGWLFLDTSRNRRRRWCDMQDCGNREKVRRFRAKIEA